MKDHASRRLRAAGLIERGELAPRRPSACAAVRSGPSAFYRHP